MKKRFGDERGVIFVLLAMGIMFVLCVMAGFAIDVGRAYVVKGELQIAADAAALAGAGNLYAASPAPASSTAITAAEGFIGKNRAAGELLTGCDVRFGYWDTSLPSSQRLQSTTMPGLAPAIEVTVSKSPGNNGGSLKNIFANQEKFGWPEFQPKANAVAMAELPPNAVQQGVAFPFVINQCLKDDLLSGRIPLSEEITLTKMYGTSSGSKQSGQWTSLGKGIGSGASLLNSYIRYMIDPNDLQGTPQPAVKANVSEVDIATGTINTVYQSTKQLIDAGKGLVYMPVVDCDIALGSPMFVRGFIRVKLTDANEPTSTIKGRLIIPAKLVR